MKKQTKPFPPAGIKEKLALIKARQKEVISSKPSSPPVFKEIATSEEFAVGDRVKFSEFYFANYPKIKELGLSDGVVSRLKTYIVPHLSLDKEGKRMYIERYGEKDSYECSEILVKFRERPDLFMCSQFGLVKV